MPKKDAVKTTTKAPTKATPKKAAPKKATSTSKASTAASAASATLSFSTPADLERWLSQHHDTHTELWVRAYKKGSGTPSVTWGDIVIAGLIWGWIDGLKRSLDDVSFLQRMTPRRPKSSWSKKNCEHVERLIAEGRMQPQGLAHVLAAKADGRWDNAYEGSATMVIPEDFLAALAKHKTAQKNYALLSRSTLFRVYYRLNGAKTDATRLKRIDTMIAQLREGTTIT